MTTSKLAALRQIMHNYGADFYFVPSVDPHRNEYVPAHWQRRAFISEFTGSAGDVLVSHHNAYLWTDPRYFLQAELELDTDAFELIKIGASDTPSLTHWLAQQQDNLTLALDPKVINIKTAHELESLFKQKHGKILYATDNWIDQIWPDQPTLPQTPIHLHDACYAGESVADKLNKVRAALSKQHAQSLVLNSLEAICWLLNIRGNDIQYNPFVIANAIVSNADVILFVDPHKVTQQVQQHLVKNNITLKPYPQFGQALQTLQDGVLLDPILCNKWIDQQIKVTKIYSTSPITRLKAVKNNIEQQGMRQAHIFDAIAVIKFLHWLEHHWHAQITELSAAEKLEAFRREEPHCVDLSFNTISGFGRHGAIIHYAATPETNCPIDDSSLYLIDSGGQYPMGTTDITRTIALGTPTALQKHHYTLVLKGHLALRHLVFPKGTCGEDINAFAHAPLWKEGLDYGHGTGHGVGCYACVHQSPPVISARRSNTPLEPGMVVSNEPGVYLEGHYGIRIENLVLTVDANKESPTQHGPFYCFEDLTLVPYARNLIAKHELTPTEIKQIDTYHQHIYVTLHPYLKDKTVLAWLKHATSPL